jgi:hypothetical protein
VVFVCLVGAGAGGVPCLWGWGLLVAGFVSFGDVAGAVCCCDGSVGSSVLYRDDVVRLPRVVRSCWLSADVAEGGGGSDYL